MIPWPSPVQPANRVPTPAGRRWIKSWWKAYVAVVIVVIAVLAIADLISAQPLSCIRIVLHNQESEYTADVVVRLDDQVVMGGQVLPGESRTGVCNVKAGSHFLAIEFHWSGTYPSGGYWYEGFDGIPDWTHTVYVLPLFTKNVQITLAYS